MGVSGSLPAGAPGVSSSATPPPPAVPHNKHLAHVRDPRSPSAGIPRTPIEVLSSQAGSPQPGPAEPAPGACQDRDPRSPTPGISRTPMRAPSSADSVERLVKQLSEAFGAEAASPEPAPPPAEDRAPPSDPEAVAAPAGEADRPPSPGTAPARPARPAGPGGSGSKPMRRKTNTKIMATSGGTGRSPLSILLDDNAPSSPAPRQGKRHVLGENLGEKREVTVDLNRSLKSGTCAWSDLNKENQRCPFVEN